MRASRRRSVILSSGVKVRDSRPPRQLVASLLMMGLLVATSVRAAPAVVRVFETAARSAPSQNAPVVHVFSEQSSIFVSEEVTDGWRRVRLPDGGTGYIRDSDIRVVTAPSKRPGNI